MHCFEKVGLTVAKFGTLAFVSSTTQAVKIDEEFLDCLLQELPKHPHIQVRLGLHPGIQDLDTYLTSILSICRKYSELDKQFKIILPDDFLKRLKTPAAFVDNPAYQNLFLRAAINGQESSSVADRVAQAVPGALLNQAALEGKPAFASSGNPYLPKECFSSDAFTFFSEKRKPPRTPETLNLDQRTTGERCAEVLLKLGSQP